MEFDTYNILEEDIDTIYDLGCAQKDFSADDGENCFWPKKTLLRLINSKDDVMLKLVVNEKIVGFSITIIHPATKKAVLENFFIIKEYRYLENDFLKKTEDAIKEKDAEFIAYIFDTVDDSNTKELFNKQGYYEGNINIWYHKNISFSNPTPKNN